MIESDGWETAYCSPPVWRRLDRAPCGYTPEKSFLGMRGLYTVPVRIHLEICRWCDEIITGKPWYGW